MLGEGSSVHLWHHTALGGCEPGVEPEPSAFIGQAFLSPAEVWTKTYTQQDRVPLIHLTHAGFCDGRASKSCKRPTVVSTSAPLPGEALPGKGARSCADRSCLSCLHLPVQGSRWVSINDQVSEELFAFCVALRLPLPFHFSDFRLSTQH